MTESESRSRFRSRTVLLLVAAMFLGSFVVAATLFFSGWQPGATRNFGQMLSPYPELQALPLQQADGQPFAWQPQQRNWHILVPAPATCDSQCSALLDTLHRVWYSEGRHAERLQVLWFGGLPATPPQFSGLRPMAEAPDLVARLPELAGAGGIPVYLVDPHGYVVLHYSAGFNPSGLRKDLGRLLK